MTGPMALNLFVPSMPGIGAVFQAEQSTVQLTLTLFLLGVAIGQLLYGPLSDRFGRRPVLLGGLTLFASASLLASLAPTIEALILLRAAQAVGGCAGMVLTRAIVRDIYSRDRAASALGYITAGMAVAPAISPAIGSYLDLLVGWRAGFVFTGLFGAIILFLTYRSLPETNFTRIDRIDFRGSLRTYRQILTQPVYLGYALSTGFTTGAFFAFLSGAPFVVVEVIQASPQHYGVCFVLVAAGYICGNTVAGRISARVGNDRMIIAGIVTALVGATIMSWFAFNDALTLVTLFGPMSIISFGNGLSQPNGIAGGVSSVDPHHAGAASGLLGCLQMAIGGLWTVVLGQATGATALPLVMMMTLSTGLSFLALVLVPDIRRAGLRLGGRG